MEMRYIKSLAEIRREIGKVYERSETTLRILHSSERGGGLFVKKLRIETYFGTGKPVEMELFRQLRAVYLVKGNWWIYGEWLEDRHNYIIESLSETLPEDLFEI